MKDFLGNFYLAIEWRVIATTITFIAAYVVSGSFTVSIEIASIEVLVKTVVQMLWLKYRVKKGYTKVAAQTAAQTDG